MLSNLVLKLKDFIAGDVANDHNPSPPATRRRDERHEQAGRQVTITAGKTRFTCQLRNLSARGIAGEVDVLPQIGTAVVVEFERGFSASGIVKWVKGRLIGIAFQTCLPMDVVDGSIGSKTRGSTREQRFAVARAATASVGATRMPVIITNISASGMRVETSFPLAAGQVIRVDAGNLPALYGRVRWSRPGVAGIRLNTPISLEEFDRATETARRRQHAA